jgi:hypothetical protein
MTTATPTVAPVRRDSLDSPCPDLQQEDRANRIHDLADRLREDMHEQKRRPTLTDIWEMERMLTTLEYEMLDGEGCATGDAC